MATSADSKLALVRTTRGSSEGTTAPSSNRERRGGIVEGDVMGNPGIIGPGYRGVSGNAQTDWLHRRGGGEKGRAAHAERAGGACWWGWRRRWGRGWGDRAVTAASARD